MGIQFEKFYNIAIEYYNKAGIVDSILPFLHERETVFIKQYPDDNPDYNNLKYKRIENKNDFNWNCIKMFHQFRRQYNIYHSIARFKNGLPIISYAGMDKETMKANKDNWKIQHQSKIYAFDLLLDYDAKSYNDLKFMAKDTLKINNILKKRYKCNPRTIFSGRGFQVLIPYEELTKLHKYPFIEKEGQMNIYKQYKKIAKDLHDKYTETIDMAGYDSMKICKVPNTLVINTLKTQDIYVSKILTDEMLKDFNLEMVRYNA